MDRIVDIVADNSFGRGAATVVDRQKRRHHRSRYARAYFHRTRGFRTVAHHAGDVRHHILDCGANLSVVAPHQIGDAAASSCRSHYAAAKGGQATEALLDVD